MLLLLLSAITMPLWLPLLIALPHLALGRRPQARAEVYGFSISDQRTYLGYDWDVLTTVGWRIDPGLVETAHRHGARVELNAGAVADIMGDPAARAAWIQEQLALAAAAGAGEQVRGGQGDQS